jgi:hypothetical protein
MLLSKTYVVSEGRKFQYALKPFGFTALSPRNRNTVVGKLWNVRPLAKVIKWGA